MIESRISPSNIHAIFASHAIKTLSSSAGSFFWRSLNPRFFLASRATLPIYLIWLTAIGLLAGCKGGIDQTLEQTIEEDYDLAPNESLSVKNEDGSIRLYGSDSQGIHLQAIKKAYSQERLDRIKVQVSKRAGSVSIETIFPPKKKWSLSDRSGTVDYIIIFPQDATIKNLELVNGEISIDGLREGSARASLVNGRMSARNCFGNLDYQVVNGGIDFYYNWWEESTYLVKAAIPNGEVGVFLPRDSSFRVEAETQGGSIMSNFIEDEQRPHGRTKRLATTIGSEPEPTFQIKATNGNIRIEGY